MGATAGQTRWTLMPQNQSNISQIKSFASSSIDKKLDGLLLTFGMMILLILNFTKEELLLLHNTAGLGIVCQLKNLKNYLELKILDLNLESDSLPLLIH